jgi:outer membrane protein insertion porin family
MENPKVKSWKICFYFCLLTFCLTGNLAMDARAGGQTDPVEPAKQGQIIESIKTEGNRTITEAQMMSKARSRAGEVFDPDTAAEDAKRIAELEGVKYAYYNTAAVDGKVRLTFVVVEKDIVRSVDFSGNNKYKDSTLAKQLHFKKGDYLDPVLAEADRISLTEFYQKKGFHFVKVALDRKKLDEGHLFYIIDEGPRVKIAAVRFEGNASIKTSNLANALKTKKKKFLVLPNYYSQERVTSDVVKLQNIYYQRGFLNAAVTSKENFSSDRSKVELTFLISEGPVYSVDKIIFTGNKQFSANELLAEAKLKPAEIYSKQKADSEVKRLLKLYRENGFIDVNIEHKRSFALTNKVDVEYEIKEGERFRIGRINITGNEQTQDKVVRRVLDEYDFQPGKWYNRTLLAETAVVSLKKMSKGWH